MWSVMVDGLDSRGVVVQYVESTFATKQGALARKNRINTRIDDFPNMVAWIEDDGLDIDEAFITNNQAKLNRTGVEEIRARLAKGERVDYLADEFNVSRKTITRVKHGHTWNE